MQEVKTKYNHLTEDLGKYIKNRIRKSKNINNVFERLKKENYNVIISDNEKGKQAEITGLFNGNIHYIWVFYNEVDNGDFKQEITGFLY